MSKTLKGSAAEIFDKREISMRMIETMDPISTVAYLDGWCLSQDTVTKIIATTKTNRSHGALELKNGIKRYLLSVDENKGNVLDALHEIIDAFEMANAGELVTNLLRKELHSLSSNPENSGSAGTSKSAAAVEAASLSLAPTKMLKEQEILSIGGQNGSGILSRIESYNPDEDSSSLWHTQLCIPRRYHNCVLVDGKLYIIGGDDGCDALDTVEMMDPHGPANVLGSIMNEKRYSSASATIDDNWIFVFGGENLSSAECLNVSRNVWEMLATMPTIRWGHTAETIGDYMYLIGGWVDGRMSNPMLGYHPAVNQFTLHEGMFEAKTYHASAVQREAIVVSGGRNVERVTSSCSRFDPRADRWMQLSDMNIAREDHAMVRFGDYLFVLGGSTSNGYSSHAESYDCRMDRWVLMSRQLLEPRAQFEAVVI